MRRPASLTLRLSLLFAISATLVFSGLGWFIEDSIKRHFMAEDASELEIVARAVDQALFSGAPGEDPDSLKRRFDDILVGHHGASLHISDSNGRTIYSSAEPDLSKLAGGASPPAGTGPVRDWSDGSHAYRVLSRHLGGDMRPAGRAYSIVVAVPIDHHLRFLKGFRYTLWLLIAGGIGVTSFMGWIAVRQGHAPLHRMVEQIRRISASELNTRLSPESVPGELADLAASFNDMLGRMEEAFSRLSNFSADIAHELRTPVTSLMTQTQVALSQTRTVDEYREILYSNIEEYEHMAQMIGDMLFLAQADNGLCKPDHAEVDLAAEIHNLFDYYEAWAEERDVRLILEGNASASGDRSMLRRALGNLLSNAIRHTPSGQTVRVILGTSNNEISIEIENPTAEISAEHLPKLFDRFYRVEPSHREGGTGLGLAIVKSIVEAHGGNIGVTVAAGHVKFRITLPNPPATVAS